jgi:hypothetical protein
MVIQHPKCGQNPAYRPTGNFSVVNGVPKFRKKVLDSVTLEGYLLDMLPKVGEGRPGRNPAFRFRLFRLSFFFHSSFGLSPDDALKEPAKGDGRVFARP